MTSSTLQNLSNPPKPKRSQHCISTSLAVPLHQQGGGEEEEEEAGPNSNATPTDGDK